MLCQRCKKREATISRKENIDKKDYIFYYCKQCYTELCEPLTSSVNQSFAELLGESNTKVAECPVCRTTIEEYQQTGLLGCATCYDVLKQELLPYIRRIQGKDTHVGKAFKEDHDKHDLIKELTALQEKMEKALKGKRFAEASVINARIVEINKILYGGRMDD